MRHAAATAHASEGSVALSLSDPFCVRRHQREFLDLLIDDVDILLGNEEEVTMLFGASSYPGAVAAAEETGLLVVMTRGAQGATVLTARGPEEIPAAAVERVVDTTGAGDLFAAGLPLRAHPRDGPGGEHPARRAVRGRGDLPHRVRVPRPTSRRWRPAPACWPGSRRLVSLSIGIVGLPNVGKSTLFNALTNNEVLAANYPFATIEPNVGVVAVPDPRLERLAALYDGAPVVPATVTFVDIAGLVRGASQGEGLGNQFLAAIRETDAICQVVRVFHDDDVVHVDGRVDPAGDIETVNTELILADLQTVEQPPAPAGQGGPQAARRSSRRSTPSRTAGADPRRRAAPSRARRPSGEVDAAPAARPAPADAPSPSSTCSTSTRARSATRTLARGAGRTVAPGARRSCCAPRSRRRWRDSTRPTPRELLASYGQEESGLEQLVHVGFATLGLQTFLTAGPKEARAWTIHVGDTAPKAAGVIHTDFERGFIKAEVDQLRRPDGGRLGRRGAHRRQGAHGGQGLRHARRRRGGVPLQHLSAPPAHPLPFWFGLLTEKGVVICRPSASDHVPEPAVLVDGLARDHARCHVEVVRVERVAAVGELRRRRRGAGACPPARGRHPCPPGRARARRAAATGGRSRR